MKVIVVVHGELLLGAQLGPLEEMHVIHMRQLFDPGMHLYCPDTDVGIRTARDIAEGAGCLHVSVELNPLPLEVAKGSQGPERMRQLYEFLGTLRESQKDTMVVVGAETAHFLLFAAGVDPAVMGRYSCGAWLLVDLDSRECVFNSGPYG